LKTANYFLATYKQAADELDLEEGHLCVE